MKRLTAKGYKVVKDMTNGNVVVTPPTGFTKIFPNITQAIKYYL